MFVAVNVLRVFATTFSFPISNKSNGDLASVVILDTDSTGWRQGPSLLSSVASAPMVEHPRGGVLMIIGKAIHHLAHAGPNANWEILPQTIKKARIWFVAFLVPDNIIHCSN